MYNEELIKELTTIQEIAGITGSVYREKAYRKAISEIKRLKFDITRENIGEVAKMKIPGIGKGIMSKIIEFIESGRIAEIDEMKKSREYTAYVEFSKITGVGPATINEWIKKHIYNLRDLRNAIAQGKVVLNNMQKYGLRYYDDLNERIPRTEVTTLGDYIKRILIQIDPKVMFVIAGSYRRGAETSGDIDILVSNKEQFHDDLLSELVQVLRNDRNFIDTLSEGMERVTFLYKSPISGKTRQIDILNIRYGSYYAAMLYFTGDFSFNEAMRGYAKARGYRLNQQGLFRYVGKALTLVPTHSEKEIFDILGLKYVEPSARAAPQVQPK